MGKVKLLLDVIGDLRSLADSLQAVSDAVADNDAAEAEMTTTKEPEKAGKAGKGAAKNTEKKDAKPAAKQEEKSLTLEEVRAVLAEKSRSGHTEEERVNIIPLGATSFPLESHLKTVFSTFRATTTYCGSTHI